MFRSCEGGSQAVRGGSQAVRGGSQVVRGGSQAVERQRYRNAMLPNVKPVSTPNFGKCLEQ